MPVLRRDREKSHAEPRRRRGWVLCLLACLRARYLFRPVPRNLIDLVSARSYLDPLLAPPIQCVATSPSSPREWTFFPSAQPLQGCCVIGHLPMVAPRRCNHGLCGRIPLGFPEGDFPMPITAFAGSPPHLRSSAPSADNPSPFAFIGVHSRFFPSLWAPVLALRAGCKPSVPPGTPSTNTHPCKAGPVISIRQTFSPLPEFNPTPHDPPEYHIPPTGHSWIARTSMLTSEAPRWSRTRHSWQHSAG